MKAKKTAKIPRTVMNHSEFMRFYLPRSRFSKVVRMNCKEGSGKN